MLRRGLVGAVRRPWRTIANRSSSSKTTTKSNSSLSCAVNSILLRSLKEHYLEVSKMTPPPKVSPPSPFTILKGALDSNGPVLKREYGDEEISLSVMRLANIVREGGDEDDEDEINQLFLLVNISKPEQEQSLQFMCGLYPDALGIHSVAMRPKAETSGFIVVPNKYNGPVFQDLDEKMRDALHGYVEERGINEELFQFLQAWLYVKDHRNLMRWFRTVATLIKQGSA